jgi:tripartite ATP-independent transporter DctM subunit
MLLTIFIVGFVILLIAGVPVAFCLVGTAFISGFAMWGFSGIPLDILSQRVLAGMNNYTILAIPLFLLAGKLMNAGSITERIFNFSQSLVGYLPGGLGYVNVLGSVIFAGMSGNAVADAAGLGAIEIKAMEDNGFDTEFSVAVTGVSSLLSPIIPPSVPMVMYGVLSGSSVAALFLGGIVPGLLMAVAMSVMVFYYSVKRNYPRGPKPTVASIMESVRKAFLPLLTPIVIVGGIWFGVFTPTEAAGVAVFYSFVLIMFVYRAMTWKELWRILRESLVDCTTIVLITGCIAAYGYVLTRTQLPLLLARGITSVTTNPLLIMLLLNVFLLIIGCFMSTMEAIILFTPIFVPLLQQAQIDLVVFGVIMCVNLMIGQLTPPFGMVLFVLAKVSRLPLNRVVMACLPFTIPVLIVLMICIIFPRLVTFIPYTLMY